LPQIESYFGEYRYLTKGVTCIDPSHLERGNTS
jgi:hypothetical protein